jgi:hypothetical protein
MWILQIEENQEYLSFCKQRQLAASNVANILAANHAS